MCVSRYRCWSTPGAAAQARRCAKGLGAGNHQNQASGSSDSPNVVPGAPGCLPGRRPVCCRSDRFLLPLVNGLSDDGGFEELEESRPSLPGKITDRAGRSPSAWALAGLIAVAAGQRRGDPVAGIAVTLFICHVGYEVTADVTRHLADGVNPRVISAAEATAGGIPGVIHAHARVRWTGRVLRVGIEACVDPSTTAREADSLGRQVAEAVAGQLPDLGSFTWTTRAVPGLNTARMASVAAPGQDPLAAR